MAERKLLTEEMIKRTAAPPAGQIEIPDEKGNGLSLRIASTGARSLVFRGRVKGQLNPETGKAAPPIRYTILALKGDESGYLAAARVRAREIADQCSKGIDPRPNAAPAGGSKGTLREAWERYRDVHLRRKQRSALTVHAYQRHFDLLLADWLDKPLRELGENRKLVAQRHDEITAANGVYRANACMRTLRAVYNHACKTDDTLPPYNPAKAVDWNEEKRRNTAMGVKDLPAWFAQLAQLPNPIRREFHLFTLLSGCRPAALREAKVEHFDFKRRVLHIPKPKGGADKAFDIPLSPPMILSLVRAIRASRALHPAQARTWIFASRVGCIAHQQESRLSTTSNDLRQTYRTLGEAADVSAVSMHLLMNHSLPGVNAGYITKGALADTLRKDQGALSRFILGAAGDRDGWPFVTSRRCIREAVERGRAELEREAA